MTDDEIREYLVKQSEGLKDLLLDLEKRLGAPTGALTSLPQQDDWSTVIKCHALIEGAVSGMLSAALDERLRKIFNMLELGREDTGKLAFAKSLDMLTAEQRGFVRELSKIRNLLAHDLKHLDFTLDVYVEKMQDSARRKQFVAALCFGLNPEKSQEWYDFVRKNLKAGLLSATLRLIVHAIQEGEVAAIDKEESKNALNDMIKGRLVYPEDIGPL